MNKSAIEQTTREIASALAGEPGALLPILHALQEHFSYIPEQCVPVVAQTLNLSRAEIHGVISFYDWFHTEPSGTKTLYVCCAEACQSMGSAAVETAAKQHPGVDANEGCSVAKVRLQRVYCLGNCACSPSVMVDDNLYSRVTPQGIGDIIDTICKEKP